MNQSMESGRAAPAPDLHSPLRALFAARVVVASCDAPADPAALFAGERADIARAAAARAGEFAAGRLCARRALAELGLDACELRVGEHRQPRWPAGVVGSITHTDGWYAAAVARASDVAALGLDSERVGRITDRLLPRIASAAEIAWVERCEPADRAAAASLLFSAKEAFYKAQFPLTHERLGFHDVAVVVPAWRVSDAAVGEFEIRAARPLAIEAQFAAAPAGRFVFHGRFVSAGMLCLRR